MARIRSIKPELASDATLANVSIPARYTFVLAITQADDHGLLAGAARQILGALYPLDEDISALEVLGWIQELVEVGLLRWRTTRDGLPVLQIVKWKKHQRIDNAGRSQLGALLVESPDDQPADTSSPSSGVPLTIHRESPRTTANGRESPLGSRTLDLGSSTLDLGSRTTDHPRAGRARRSGDPVVVAAAEALTLRANQGLADHPTRPQPEPRILATSAASHQTAETILEAGVPLAFAEEAVYRIATLHSADGPVRSLKYFADAVIRSWQHAQEGVRAETRGRPTAAGTDPFLVGLDRWLEQRRAEEGPDA